jgi:hypothetical protein
MRGRFISALVLIGLFFSVIVAPTIVYANGHSSAHASEMLDLHGIADADHTGSPDADGEMPCHAVSHHHCSIALQLDASRVDLKALTTDSMTRPASTSPLLSRSQAPPLDPPIA